MLDLEINLNFRPHLVQSDTVQYSHRYFVLGTLMNLGCGREGFRKNAGDLRWILKLVVVAVMKASGNWRPAACLLTALHCTRSVNVERCSNLQPSPMTSMKL
jgi:hypothetical protein